ncbi:MAG: 50S ribosomal protein L23 [Saprospiraceae bacterium]|nr:50S ribosomal protein L23 [Saprospiraceae bacterium]MBK7812276.1 50S ribosomal protein L23 [Saprospiraceae bacterium]MBK9632503.1 50S ribosomal protein L23 [Saprospiraceae bacterium]
MVKEIIIKPVITEKAEKLSKSSNQYTFVVRRDANKIEIQKAISSMYNVAVESVNTMVMPGKEVVRNTKRNMLRGRKSAYKKAIVTLAAGEEINIYSEE